jgi:beta-lactamase regulating signal transducer with metallopeptidase domain
MNAILIAFLNSLWQSAAIAAAVWIALRLARGVNAATRHAVWWAVLAVAVLLPLVPHRFDNPAPALPMATFEAADTPPLPAGPRQEIAPVAYPVELPSGQWPALFFGGWALACAVQVARTGWSYAHLRRLKRDARPAEEALRRNFDAWTLSCRVRRSARLLLTDRIASPMAVGFRAPAVLLPESLLPEFGGAELDHVLLHELAHMARRDDWTNLAARLASALFAFHPVALWIVRQIDREREMACDDWVVSMTGEARPYATSLTRLFELCRARNRDMLATGMATRGSNLGERIEMLLRARRQFLAKVSAPKIAFACLALVAAGIAFSQTPRLLGIAQDRHSPPVTVAFASPEPVEAPEPSPEPEQTEPPAPPEPPGESAAPPQAAPPAPPVGGFLAGLVAAGYGDLPVDAIIALKSHGIDGPFLAGMAKSGWGKLDAGELINLHDNGVSPEYARAVRDAGLRDVSLKEVVLLHQQGVHPDVIKRIHGLGFGPFSAGEAVALQQNGVGVELFQAFRDAGWKELQVREAIDARNAGIEARNLAEARQYGSLTLKQVIRLKQAGVL